MLNILNISKNSLAVNQFALEVTSANVANVNTPGYSRQRPVIKAQGGVSADSGSITLGVTVTEVQRMYDNYLERQVIGQAQAAGYSAERRSLFTRLEAVFEESRGGRLGDNLNRFWQGWEDLALNPSGWVERSNLIAAARTLVDDFHDYDSSLKTIRTDIAERIADSIGQINQTLEKIADLNLRIFQIARDDGSENNLRDQRNELIKNLAAKIEFDYFEDERGAVSIIQADGRSLVAGLERDALRQDIAGNITIAGYPHVVVNKTISARENGQLSALLRLRDEVLPGYQAKLDQLAAALTEAVNSQHRLGFDQGGNRGVNFFVPAARASEMALFLKEPRDLAASITAANEGDNARAIAALKDKPLLGGSFSINQFFAGLVGQVGLEAAQANRMDQHRQLVFNNVMQRREEFSGVSLDEEMMNLIKYQMGYNAAGRLFQTADELLQTLIKLGA